MTSAPRILPDLVSGLEDFSRKLDQILEPTAMAFLSKKHPDGVEVRHIAEHHRLAWSEAVEMVEIAWAAWRLNIRRGPNGTIRYVWPVNTVPPLNSVEKGLLRQARRDLADGPDKIFIDGAAMDLGVGPGSVRNALDFLVTAGLLTREGKTFALTELGRTEGDSE
ncbi:hypothetical protein [Roseibium sediminicola]|uniref:DprA winged helix domain-containing protein n=1 Tax=Roseibium sediminicola TaxID=2933272 RepID=A0ABT0GRD5_9HYPH|nr:hypothetical protein [Roseibium sp. CAU 1639]MCK7611987.1 hypothetical protein [Roseibium sp. CAU 1639]